MSRLNKYIFSEDASFDRVVSPIGELTVIHSHVGIRAVLWPSDLWDKEVKSFLVRMNMNPLSREIKNQFKAYFEGKLKKFNVALDPIGTEFQKRTWKVLQSIPYGKTMSYGDQAERIGGRRYARAVGHANARNPISIVVPCHRVVAKSGDLSGFAGGVDTKRFLLDLEAQHQR